MQVKLVTIEHFVRGNQYGSSGHFTFGVPENVDLKCGDFVMCDTAKGPNQLGVCLCDSFTADSEVAFPLLGIKKLKQVKAVLKPVLLIPQEGE